MVRGPAFEAYLAECKLDGHTPSECTHEWENNEQLRKKWVSGPPSAAKSRAKWESSETAHIDRDFQEYCKLKDISKEECAKLWNE